jgi:hypothetical protein
MSSLLEDDYRRLYSDMLEKELLHPTGGAVWDSLKTLDRLQQLPTGQEAKDMLDTLLGSQVRLASLDLIASRLHSSPSAVSGHTSVHTIEQCLQNLSSVAGELIAIKDVMELVSSNKQNLLFGSVSDPLSTLMGSALLLADESAIIIPALVMGRMTGEPGELAGLKNALNQDPDKALTTIENQAPHNPQILPEVIALADNNSELSYKAQCVVESFGIAALPLICEQLKSNDPSKISKACNYLRPMGRLGSAAIEPLWQALESLPDQETKHTRHARWLILDAIRVIGGDRIADFNNTIDMLKTAYEVNEGFYQDEIRRSALSVIAGMGQQAGPLVSSIDERDREGYELAAVMRAMGSAAWEYLPEILPRRDLNFWSKVSASVGAPSQNAEQILLKQVEEKNLSPIILKALDKSSLEVRCRAFDLIEKNEGMQLKDHQDLIGFLTGVAQDSNDPFRKSRVIELLKEQGNDPRTFNRLVTLLSGEALIEHLREGLGEEKTREDALLALQYTVESSVAEAFNMEVDQIGCDSKNSLQFRQLAWSILGTDEQIIERLTVEHMLNTNDSKEVSYLPLSLEQNYTILENLLNAKEPAIRTSIASRILQSGIEYINIDGGYAKVRPEAVGAINKLFLLRDSDNAISHALSDYGEDASLIESAVKKATK